MCLRCVNFNFTTQPVFFGTVFKFEKISGQSQIEILI